MFSFEHDKKRVELQTYVRAIVDVTTPNRSPLEGTKRTEQRYNRLLPVLMVPWKEGRLLPGEAKYGVTKDFCDRGISVVMARPVLGEDVVLGLWPRAGRAGDHDAGPVFFLGKVRHAREIGAGLRQVGVELNEVIKSRKLTAALEPLAQHLLPHACR